MLSRLAHLAHRRPRRLVAAALAVAVVAGAFGFGVASKLGPSDAELGEAYRLAAREPWRKRLADEWTATETEAWPD